MFDAIVLLSLRVCACVWTHLDLSSLVWTCMILHFDLHGFVWRGSNCMDLYWVISACVDAARVEVMHIAYSGSEQMRIQSCGAILFYFPVSRFVRACVVCMFLLIHNDMYGVCITLYWFDQTYVMLHWFKWRRIALHGFVLICIRVMLICIHWYFSSWKSLDSYWIV